MYKTYSTTSRPAYSSTKVYYADGSEAPTTSTGFGSFGYSTNLGGTTGKVYYRYK